MTLEMRIDDLAQRAGVPTRTIRYYTQQGLLPSPALRGRVGYYDEQHLDRLRLIKELQEKRFLPLSVIRTIVRHFESGADLETMLAPLDMVFRPRWDAPEQRALTRAELAREAGVDASVIEGAEHMGFLFPSGRGRDRRYTADDVHILAVAKEWLDLGLPIELGRHYRATLEEIARMQVQAFRDAVVEPLAHETLSPDEARDRLLEGYHGMRRVFEQLVSMLHRKLLQVSVEKHFASEIDDEVAS